MGHAVAMIPLKARTKDAAMKEGLMEAYDYAEMETDRYENPSGSYHGNFRFYDKEFNNEQEAFAFFNSLGSYCDGVVKIKTVTESQRSRIQGQIMRLEEKYFELEDKLIDNFKHRKLQTIKCKNCFVVMPNNVACDGIHLPQCCNCGEILLPEGAKKRLKTIADSIKKLKETPPSGEGAARYYAKIEVHC